MSTEAGRGTGADSVDEVASTLNQLIQTCKDGENGFKVAAESVEDVNLQHLLASYSQQRSEFAAELQSEVQRLHQDPAESGHAAAALHRGWMDIKSLAIGQDEAAIIAECERGEDVAVKAYEQALASELPADLRALVERQLLNVKEAHDQIRSLEQIHSRHH
ncbi:MAG: ferritin-like domain-containing protein [Gemmatimonadales bacterium]